MTQEEVINKYIVLYSTPFSQKEETDELVLFVFKDIPQYASKQAINLKIRNAPRRFESFIMAEPEWSRIYYWNNEIGAHLITPDFKEKEGIFRMDREEAVNYARKCALSEGAGFVNPEMENYLTALNSASIRSDFFGDRGYLWDEDTFNCDWARGELRMHFGKDSCSVGNYRLLKFELVSHWVVDEAWKMVKGLYKTGKMTIKEFADFLGMLDTYDTIVRLYYKEDGRVKTKSIFMNGSPIKGYEKLNWEPEIVKVIEEINRRK